MAALPAGVQYGLSSESSYKENKELVFVKLTDSALKAIEDFIRNNRSGKVADSMVIGQQSPKVHVPTDSNVSMKQVILILNPRKKLGRGRSIKIKF
ncbi:hypothetical protein RR48_05116 [Papilio machaon]|uniref:RNA polymerase II elongation factor ELL N-terminal domain-containing protein n=1 Tax=Papilio machaon TaxID=76193 RepID=A0A0N1I5E9_PAPMA|nr:hypothetical protein RR48_05116 [Papilio machaon]